MFGKWTEFKNIIYADDSVLISPSARGLQSLLTICDEYAIKCNLVYNSKKTVCMCVKPKCLSSQIKPLLYLNAAPVTLVSEHKYLGVQFCCDKSDDKAIASQRNLTYCRGNSLIKIF